MVKTHRGSLIKYSICIYILILSVIILSVILITGNYNVFNHIINYKRDDLNTAEDINTLIKYDKMIVISLENDTSYKYVHNLYKRNRIGYNTFEVIIEYIINGEILRYEFTYLTGNNKECYMHTNIYNNSIKVIKLSKYYCNKIFNITKNSIHYGNRYNNININNKHRHCAECNIIMVNVTFQRRKTNITSIGYKRMKDIMRLCKKTSYCDDYNICRAFSNNDYKSLEKISRYCRLDGACLYHHCIKNKANNITNNEVISICELKPVLNNEMFTLHNSEYLCSNLTEISNIIEIGRTGQSPGK